MLSKGVEPMPATYNAAVCALARLGHLSAALALLGAAAAKGIDRSVATYAALLAGCEEPGRCAPRAPHLSPPPRQWRRCSRRGDRAPPQPCRVATAR
jgi:pentatricopeptide repeat protein